MGQEVLERTEAVTKPTPVSEIVPPVTASELERLRILKKGTAYKMAKRGLIPHIRVGPKRGGVRFIPADVIKAITRPMKAEQEASAK